jgi:hypothetical protein
MVPVYSSLPRSLWKITPVGVAAGLPILVQSGRPEESHLRAPTERCVNLSVHTALLI